MSSFIFNVNKQIDVAVILVVSVVDNSRIIFSNNIVEVFSGRLLSALTGRFRTIPARSSAQYEGTGSCWGLVALLSDCARWET